MKRPSITLAWAQGIDGSIAAAPGQRTALSGPEAMVMTHGLRARHEAILVGIGTVLADDPSLTLRLVEGRSPRPVILDGRLRTPPGARLLARKDCRPLLVCREDVDAGRRSVLEAAGADILPVALDARGNLDLHSVLARLSEKGIASLMVEGGARVLASFLAAGLVDEIVVTIAPILLGGPAPFSASRGSDSGLPCELSDSRIEIRGRDVVISGRPIWRGADKAL